MTYNGHKNWATWDTMNWLGDYVNEVADRVQSGEITKQQGAQELRDMLEELNPLKNDCSLFSDIITMTIGEIDFEGLLDE